MSRGRDLGRFESEETMDFQVEGIYVNFSLCHKLPSKFITNLNGFKITQTHSLMGFKVRSPKMGQQDVYISGCSRQELAFHSSSTSKLLWLVAHPLFSKPAGTSSFYL